MRPSPILHFSKPPPTSALAHCLFCTTGVHAQPLQAPLLIHIEVPIPALCLSRSFLLLPSNIVPVSTKTPPYNLSGLLRAMLLSILLSSALAAIASADCYSHDKIKALDSKYYTGPELVSCGNGTDNCCLADQKCGSNLLCVDTDGTVSRQYCDNAAWIGCSDMCASKALIFVALSTITLTQRPGYDAAGVYINDCGNNIYCCPASDGDACCNDDRAFYVDPDNGKVVQTTAAAKTNKPRWFTVDSSSLLAGTASTSSASSSSASSPASSSASTSGSTPASTPASSTASSSASSSPTADLTSTPHGDSPGLSAGAGAGIGVGAVAAIALIGSLIWFLRRKKKQNAYLDAPIPIAGAPTEKSGGHSEYYAHRAELGDGVFASQELDGGPSRHELDGSAANQPKRLPGL